MRVQIEDKIVEAIPITWIYDHAEECRKDGLPNMADAFMTMVSVYLRETSGIDNERV